jgi:hypothetical protein
MGSTTFCQRATSELVNMDGKRSRKSTWEQRKYSAIVSIPSDGRAWIEGEQNARLPSQAILGARWEPLRRV